MGFNHTYYKGFRHRNVSGNKITLKAHYLQNIKIKILNLQHIAKRMVGSVCSIHSTPKTFIVGTHHRTRDQVFYELVMQAILGQNKLHIPEMPPGISVKAYPHLLR